MTGNGVRRGAPLQGAEPLASASGPPRAAAENKQSNPLIVRFGAIGDMILLTPLMRELHARTGQPSSIAAMGSLSRQIFKHLPFVKDLRTISSVKSPYWFCADQRRLVAELRASSHAPVFNFQSDSKTTRLLKRSGLTIANSAFSERRRVGEHVVDHYFRLAGIDPKTVARGCELAVGPEEHLDVMQWLKGIGCGDAQVVLVQPGSRRNMLGKSRRLTKNWPQERWIALIQAVLRELPAARVLVIGAPSEQETCDELARAANDLRVRSVASELPLRRLFALLAVAHSLVSVDTGPAHAAAALECPLVVLFGKADPRVISPVSRTSPVEVVTGKPIAGIGDQNWCDYHAIEDITADQAISAWKSMIASKNFRVRSRAS